MSSETGVRERKRVELTAPKPKTDCRSARIGCHPCSCSLRWHALTALAVTLARYIYHRPFEAATEKRGDGERSVL